MQEPVIQWSAIAVFSSIVVGYLAIHAMIWLHEKRRRRQARGFRDMRSIAQVQRNRAQRSGWQQTSVNRARPVIRSVGAAR